jgi:hypothetical protein
LPAPADEWTVSVILTASTGEEVNTYILRTIINIPSGTFHLFAWGWKRIFVLKTDFVFIIIASI